MSRPRIVAPLVLVAVAATAICCVAGCTPAPVIPKAACPTSKSTTSGARVSPDGKLAPSGPIKQPIAAGTTTMTSGFGPRDGHMHQGMDFAGPRGTPIYSALDGIVVKAGPASGFGNWIIVDSYYQGMNVSMVYGHMDTIDPSLVTENKVVAAGDHIADIGNAGESTGPHVHVEFWEGGRLQGGTAVDPAPKLANAPAAQPADVRLAASSRSTGCAGFGAAGAGELAAGTVPAEFEPWIRRAGSLCPGVRPPILAAQLNAEAGFNTRARSPVGASGPAQFMPGTWQTWGRPVDDNGNPVGPPGAGDITKISDAVMAQGAYMCQLYSEVEAILASGGAQGVPIELTLAAYNAGIGRITEFRGIPPYAETQGYVAKIMASAATYEAPNAGGRMTPRGSGGEAGQVVEAARQYLGTAYVWGGGGTGGPTNGGFDCSGLTSYAVHAASAGRVTLPRTSEQQWTVGVEIPLDQAQPGDLVFAEFGTSGPGHVGIYAGHGRMVHAPTTGDVVKEDVLQQGMRARRVM